MEGKSNLLKAPAFQFYAADYLADENVALMTLEEEGAYIRALAYCWREGSLPADDAKLSRLLKGCSLETLTTVRNCFKVGSSDPSRLVHPRLEIEREKQEDWRKKSSEAGKLSGKSRRAKKFHTEPTLNQPSSGVVEPNTNSSSSSSSSNKRQKQIPSAKGKPSPDPRAAEFKSDFEKAFEFVNHQQAPWDAKEATNLKRWLAKNPTITRIDWQNILQNRRKSPGINQAADLSRWIGSALAWRDGPADEWGKPIKPNGGMNGNGHGDTNLAILTESLKNRHRSERNGDVSARDVGPDNIFALLGKTGTRTG